MEIKKRIAINFIWLLYSCKKNKSIVFWNGTEFRGISFLINWHLTYLSRTLSGSH